MGTNGAVGASGLTAAGPAPWRVPVATALAVVSVPLAFFYGYGTVVAAASLVVLWPAWRVGQRSALAWAAGLVGTIGLIVGAFMLVAAVGLCGIGVLVGSCNA